MISYVLAVVSLVIIIPLVVYLPLGLTKKGKIMMAALSFSFALLGIAAQSTMELWKLLLLMLLLIVMSGYLMMKRKEQFLTVSTSAEDNYHSYSGEYEEAEYEEEYVEHIEQPLQNQEIESADEDDVLEVLEIESSYPQEVMGTEDAELEEIESAAEEQLEEIDFEQIRLTEIAQTEEPQLAEAELETTEETELSYIGELESLMSDDNAELPITEVKKEKLQNLEEENEFSHGLQLEEDDYIIPVAVENESLLEQTDDPSETANDHQGEISLHKSPLEELVEEEDMVIEVIADKPINEVMDSDDEEDNLLLDENAEDLSVEEPEIMIEEEEAIIVEEQDLEHVINEEDKDEESWIEAATASDFAEEHQENEENTTLQREMLKTLLEQLQLAKQTTEPHVYEKWIKQCMEQKMPLKEHYIFASLLIEHYISQQEHQKLITLLNELKNQYNSMPIISEQIQFLLLSYSNLEQ